MWDLVADIGGTTARVAQLAGGRIRHRRDFAMQPGRSVPGLLAEYLGAVEGRPGAVVCAGAGPKRGGEIRLTNGGWHLAPAPIAAATGAAHVHILNDFEAAAWSLATLTDADVTAIGASGPLAPGTRVALGPGTGLGVGALLWQDGAFRVLPGEGGHVAIGPRHAEDVPVFEAFAQLWPQTRIGGTLTFEAEALLSGTGLPLLYQACGGASGTSAAEVFARAEAGQGAAQRTRALFRAQLATLAGNLAVTFDATGGVFLLGGVAQQNPALFDSDFREVFLQGGRYNAYRARCGLYLVNPSDFGLRGCANALAHARRPGVPHGGFSPS